jgi:uncharacterized damage-inducible protein DinB
MKKIFKPSTGYASFYQHYLDHVPEDGFLLQHLSDILNETEMMICSLSEEQLLYRYSDDKWTIKDILVHLADCERIFVYRATRMARNDQTDLPGFDEKQFALYAHANIRKADDILKELKAFRAASLIFIETLDEEALERTGTANGYPMSVRLLVNHIYGHHKHHLDIIYTKYLPLNGQPRTL